MLSYSSYTKPCFYIKYPENLSHLSTKKQFSVLLHATCKEMTFDLNGQKIIMETQDAKQRYKEYLYAQLLKPGLYILTIKDQDETRSISFNVTN